MIITLPKDLLRIEKSKRDHKRRFSFVAKCNRMVLPREILEMFSSLKYGIDLWVSKKEKSAYIKFVPKDKAYFQYNNTNGYVGCSDLFKWLADQEIPVFADYEYSNYVVDKKNRVVKVNLVRE